MTTYFACGKMLSLDGVHTVCVSTAGVVTDICTDAGMFHVEAKDAPAVLGLLILAIAGSTFAYAGSNDLSPGAGYAFDRVTKRKHHA